jgi:hypothetical protein
MMRHVQATLEDADAGGGGRARLTFSPVPPDGRAPVLAVRRSDPTSPWRGPSGWQAAEHRFAPLEAEFRGDSLALILGREVVDAIPEFSVVELQLPEFEVTGKLSWEGVIPSYGSLDVAPPPVRAPLAPPASIGSPPPARLPQRAAPVLAAFVIGSARRVVLRPLDRSMAGPLSDPEPGEGIPGVPFAAFARAFRGTVRLDVDGTGRIVGADPLGAPQRLRFRVTPGGGSVVQALDGHPFGEQIEVAVPSQPVFGLSHAMLAEAGRGELVLDPDTLVATLVPASIGHDPLPMPPRRRSLLVRGLGVAVLLCAGGATFLLW